MTAAVVDTKKCVGCEATFRRPKDTTARQWEHRRYCTALCARRNPRPVVTAPVSRRAQMWREQAACRDAAPELFSPPEAPGQVDWPLVTRVAQTWCQTCPVRQACLDEAQAAKAWGCGLRGGVLRFYKGGSVQSVDLLGLVEAGVEVAS